MTASKSKVTPSIYLWHLLPSRVIVLSLSNPFFSGQTGSRSANQEHSITAKSHMMCVPARTRHTDRSASHPFQSWSLIDHFHLSVHHKSHLTTFLSLSVSVVKSLVSHKDSPTIKTILQLHFPSWCWQQTSLVFSPSISPNLGSVCLLTRDCFISFKYLTVSYNLQKRDKDAWIKMQLCISFL